MIRRFSNNRETFLRRAGRGRLRSTLVKASAAFLAWAAVVSFCAAVRIQAVNSMQSINPLPAAWTLPGAHRILVIAPHPDDETLGCAGLMTKVKEAGGDVRVLVLTNGDAFKVAAGREAGDLKPTPRELIKFGEERQREAIRASAHSGLLASDLLFAGMPDRGLFRLWTANWETPYTSPFTRVSATPYRNAYQPHARYTGRTLMDLLARAIDDYRPTRIFVTDPMDDHPDHYAAYAFVTAAVEELRERDPELAALLRVKTYLVHRGQWPAPRGHASSHALAPPASAAGGPTKWQAVPLTGKQISAKAAAIEEYRSQTAVMGSFLRSFARKNELFGDVTPGAVAVVRDGAVSVDGRTDDWARILPQIVSPAADTVARSLRKGADIRSVYLARDSRYLYLRMDTVKQRPRGVSSRFQIRTVEHGRAKAVEVAFDSPNGIAPKGTRYAWRGSVLEVAVPLAQVGRAEEIWAGASTHYMGFTVDKTGWRPLAFWRTVRPETPEATEYRHASGAEPIPRSEAEEQGQTRPG